MLAKNNRLIEIMPMKIDYSAKVKIATEGISAAQEIYQKAAEDFEELADFSFDDLALPSDEDLSEEQIKIFEEKFEEKIKLIESNSDLTKYFEQAREA